MQKSSIIAAAAVAVMATACSGDDSWQMTGTVHGAPADTPLVVEASENGRWFTVDTVRTDGSGRFRVVSKAPRHPSVYRLRMGEKTLFFPIDSLERLTLSTSYEAFDTDYDLGGSSDADLMEGIDKQLMEAARTASPSQVVTDSLLKRELGRKLLAKPDGVVAYYIINKRIQGMPLFDPSSRLDHRIIGAVANAYEQKRPSDPRTPYLRKLYLSGRQAKPRTVEAPATAMFDVRLYDANGKEQSLKELAAKNKVVVLNFTTLSAPQASLFNEELHKVWSQYHGNGLEVYQVCVGDEETAWRTSARNLPWVSVYQPEAGDATPLLNYNVNYLPFTYLIVDGEIARRVQDVKQLSGAVSSVLE
ncbi:MAG: redoxin domain-containing protein [Candidatus Amulumruptor caecigallinarius]|nr:redoxin domain-containing protein [Candidatus Amulumruptor caecigallinarius]MCM1396440.1 redoxin domain-containing protein [Candidatus Amulumruptor caecigallinarius]MCM1453503.1 redoxin domain-containing protein [bacterium]